MSGAFLRSAFNPSGFLTNEASSTVDDRPIPSSPYVPGTQKFVFGDGEELNLLLPHTPIEYSLGNVGGDIEADSGVRAAFRVRQDEFWTVSLRFFDREWPSVQRFIDFAQTGAPFTWYPDDTNLDESFEVQLESPALGSTYRATPLPEYPNVQLLSITVVRATAVPPAPPPPPVETPARPWLFFRSRHRWFNDYERTVLVSHDTQLVRVWGDYSGNERNGINRYGGSDPWTPKVADGGVAIRFGDPNHGAYMIPRLLFSEGELMMVFKRAAPPGMDAESAIYQLGAQGNDGDYIYKASTGHIHSTFGLSGRVVDCGPPPDNLTTRYHLWHVRSVHEEWRAKLDGATLASIDGPIAPDFTQETTVFGEVASSAWFNGFVKHFVLFNYALTPVQIGKWYSFLTGQTSTLPY